VLDVVRRPVLDALPMNSHLPVTVRASHLGPIGNLRDRKPDPTLLAFGGDLEGALRLTFVHPARCHVVSPSSKEEAVAG
jgi:hypothetical protein